MRNEVIFRDRGPVGGPVLYVKTTQFEGTITLTMRQVKRLLVDLFGYLLK